MREAKRQFEPFTQKEKVKHEPVYSRKEIQEILGISRGTLGNYILELGILPELKTNTIGSKWRGSIRELYTKKDILKVKAALVEKHGVNYIEVLKKWSR